MPSPRASLLALALALAACDAPRGGDDAVAQYDALLVDYAAPPACTRDDECAPSQFCQGRGCTGAGSCADRPPACTGGSQLVCGCNGRVYLGACEASRAGTRVAYAGMCAPADAATPDAPATDGARDAPQPEDAAPDVPASDAPPPPLDAARD